MNESVLVTASSAAPPPASSSSAPLPPVAAAETAPARGGGSSSSSKRPRPTTPRTAAAAAAVADRGANDAERAARLRHPATRVAELNDLLQLSANPEVNFALPSDAILGALTDIVLRECLELNDSSDACNDDGDDNEDEEDPDYLVFRSQGAWERPRTAQSRRFAEHCCRPRRTKPPKSDGEDENEIYEIMTAVAVLIRNFSYTGANLRLLAYDSDCLRVLTAFLYVGATDERYRRHCNNNNVTSQQQAAQLNSFEIPLAALTTLLHLVRHLDVTGQQLVADRLFYHDPAGPPVPGGAGAARPGTSKRRQPSFGQTVTGAWGGLGACRLAKRLDAREDTVDGLSTLELLQIVTIDYLGAVYGIFPALAALLTDERASRPVVVAGLDVLQEWIAAARVGLVGSVPPEPAGDLKYGQDYKLPTLRAILVHVPDALLDRLTDLLYVPRLGNDSLEYVDPVYKMVTRVNTMRLLLNYDVCVDTDVRDRALDVLVPLLELDSPRMAARLGRTSDSAVRTRLFDALVPAITTTSGRVDAAAVAAQLFRELAKAETENQDGLDYVQVRLVEVASRDPRVSQLVWKELFPVEHDVVDDDDEGDNDGDHDHDEEGEDGDGRHGGEGTEED